MPHPVIAFLAPGGGELLLVLLVLLLLFGPKDAPRILRTLQNKLKKLKHMVADFQHNLMTSDLPDPPQGNPQDTRVYDEEKASAATDPPPPMPPAEGSAS